MHKIRTIFIGVTLLLTLSAFWGCNKKYTPKPRGYFRIDLPEKEYQQYTSDAPYVFNYPVYCQIKDDESANSEKYWINVEYPSFNAKIHISYKDVNNNIGQILEDTRKLTYKHTIKADAIGEKLFIKPEKKVYGILYEVEGDAASSVQFFLTDSTNHYLRGALYFNSEPNKDSLAPVLAFIKQDITELMESFEWK